MKTIAIVPARLYSKGIPQKNLRQLGDKTLVEHAVACGIAAGCDEVWVNCIAPLFHQLPKMDGVRYWPRPLVLDTDETPMFSVIEEMAAGGCFTSNDDCLLILQPTQPFRTAAHVRAGIARVQETGADSVVSVVETTSPDKLYRLRDGRLHSWERTHLERRQDCVSAYRADGTCYVFWRRTVTTYHTIYGEDVRALVIPPEESCALDTEADWADVVRRWADR